MIYSKYILIIVCLFGMSFITQGQAPQTEKEIKGIKDNRIKIIYKSNCYNFDSLGHCQFWDTNSTVQYFDKEGKLYKEKYDKGEYYLHLIQYNNINKPEKEIYLNPKQYGEQKSLKKPF